MPEGDLKELIAKKVNFEQEIKNVKRRMEYIERRFKEEKENLILIKEKTLNEKTRLLKMSPQSDAFKNLRKEAWESGYYGNIQNVPKIPENF